jgi:AcrR family transcriptional regulator
MARPRQFDRAEALNAAVEVFWAKGFEGASTEDLTRAMRIGRQSLYGAFGDKRSLYLEALSAYNAGSVADLIDTLRRANSPLAALRDLLLAPAELPAAKRRLGCMGVNAICEFGVADPQVLAAGGPGAVALENALIRLVREAKEKGDVAVGVNEQVAAHFIQCMLSGLKVAARAGAEPAAMRAIVDLALNSLKAA